MSYEENNADERDYEAHRAYRHELRRREEMHRKAERRVRITIVLLLVVCVLGGAFFFKDYRQYLRDYDQFQEYKRYLQALEEENHNGGGTVTPSVPENTPSPEETGTPQTEIVQQPGDILSGSQVLSDVSGNVLWQADTVSEETAALLREYVQERNEVYTWENSYEKTLKINELDKKILETANCSFPGISINFVGDSITEGIGGNVDENGHTISYVNYVQSYLHFGNVINSGKAGGTVAEYSMNQELAIGPNEEQFFVKGAQITVFYAGLNDYLFPDDVKNFGVLDNGTTGGYCGQLQLLLRSFGSKNPNATLFLVTAFQTPLENPSTQVTNFDGIPTLNDYMDQQRKLAAECGYPLIDLYSIGFMDMHDAETAANLLSDSTHPNDTGYRILGEHIAAEILLYCLGIS